MIDFELFTLARAIHVLAIVLWIGGVAFITTVLLPAIQALNSDEEKIALFERLEHKFSWQAKVTTLAAGISGYVMLEFLNAWQRYLDASFWWLHLMTLVWFIFTLVLFVLEPLFLHRWFMQQAQANPQKTFSKILNMHRLLLALSLLAVFGGVAGAHGYL
ncbi:hypothetical protein [Litorilituus sediminis]|uniref:DUF4149 domain-containing protein n=1 Tax=Litorilituus sediminis TaxID=718192 RepID=A0A4P6PA06_9GAMM|nr:hypothetical protein [Litorilituus sediminis]QBG36405.1 hypothetical protein EMK97_12095 [Litorilituus sediminis]